MNLPKLKREVIVPVRFPLIAVIACSLLGALALNVGLKAACEERSPQVAAAAADACGITDPAACAVSIMESVADLFRPEMPAIMTVTYTATIVEAPNCGLIMDTFHALQRERILEMPGLLEQVEECRLLYRSSSID